MERERYPSEKSTVTKERADVFYAASCILCGSTKDIELWPHRNGHEMMVGMVFACKGCREIVQGVSLTIEGIRGERNF
jgi:hypothetical protein